METPNIINDIKSALFSEGLLDNQEGSHFQKLLSDSETSKLSQLFSGLEIPKESDEKSKDLRIKFLALNSLYIFIQNSPENSKKEFDVIEGFSEKLAHSIFELSVIRFRHSKDWTSLYYMVAYAALAEKLTLLDIESSLERLDQPATIFHKLIEFICIIFIPVRTSEDLKKRNLKLGIIKHEFSQMQDGIALDNTHNYLEIVALSNIIDVIDAINLYLAEGVGKNISPMIDNSTVNAAQVFSFQKNREWELISNLLRFVLRKLHSHSVWTYANSEPYFKDFIKEQYSKNTILLSLFPSQRQALSDILTSSRGTVISMPTSSGKTLLAELKIAYIRSLHGSDSLVAYVVPSNALVNQVLKKLRGSFPELRVERLLPFNHFDSLEQGVFSQNNVDILISTPEKLSFLMKNNETKILEKLKLLVVDEAHNIGDKTRGSVIEFLISNFKQEDKSLSYLLLTPFIKNNIEIAKWLDENSFKAKSIEWSPTKQYIGYLGLNPKKTEAKIHYLRNPGNIFLTQDLSIDLEGSPKIIKNEISNKDIDKFVYGTMLVDKYRNIKGTILILESSHIACAKLAEILKQRCKKIDSTQAVEKNKLIAYAKKLIESELGPGYPLIDLLDYGIAFHHAKIPPNVKEAIENLVTDNAIKILIATTTLAQGMNFPIKVVIFSSMNLGRGATSRKMSTDEFWNIAGRAGRAYMDTEGHIIVGFANRDSHTKNITRKMIAANAKSAISSLTDFFSELNADCEFKLELIKNSPIAQNFLHYLNHIMNIAFDYKLDKVSQNDIRYLLTNSLFYQQEKAREGFYKTQDKIINFCENYVSHLKSRKVHNLKLADVLGITDISLSNAFAACRKTNPQKLSQCIDSRNIQELGKVIDVINIIPELKINFGDFGIFDSQLIAKIMLDWIELKSIGEISKNCGKSLDKCTHYIFSNLKIYMPWGLAIFQKVSKDNSTDEKDKLLPSYAFFGVNDPELVKLAYVGVPRFALRRVNDEIKNKKIYDDIEKLRKYIYKHDFKIEEDKSENRIVNEIIKKSIV